MGMCEYFRIQPAPRAAVCGRACVRISILADTDRDNGIPGNDDAGQLSAWYICAVLGFYPTDPTSATMTEFRQPGWYHDQLAG